MRTYWTSADQAELDNAAETLILLVTDLDDWITFGGFLPHDWQSTASAGETP